jgi:hypothetical protein
VKSASKTACVQKWFLTINTSAKRSYMSSILC